MRKMLILCGICANCHFSCVKSMFWKQLARTVIFYV